MLKMFKGHCTQDKHAWFLVHMVQNPDMRKKALTYLACVNSTTTNVTVPQATGREHFHSIHYE